MFMMPYLSSSGSTGLVCASLPNLGENHPAGSAFGRVLQTYCLLRRSLGGVLEGTVTGAALNRWYASLAQKASDLAGTQSIPIRPFQRLLHYGFKDGE